MKNLDKKIALVTSATRGIGLASAVKLAKEGAIVYMGVRRLDATQEMKELYSTTPIVTMSMGKLGMISRLSGEIFGSSITFGTISDKVSAPGQICIEELKNALDIIHKSV